MGRIRTIKPEFFKHADLFDAEKEFGLPLRVAFAGLWTVADREGRFRWKPREIKLDVLPYDDVDFSRVLDALMSRGFIEKYTDGRDFFGLVPSFDVHQVINNRESESKLPNTEDLEAISPPVADASTTPLNFSQGEGKGREGKGKGRGRSNNVHFAKNAKSNDFFEQTWKVYPKKQGRDRAEKSISRFLKSGCSQEDIAKATVRYADHVYESGTEYVMNGSTFFAGVWKDWVDRNPATEKVKPVDQILEEI